MTRVSDTASSRREKVVEIVRGGWPMRHDYFGVRLTLRSLLRMERQIRRGR